MMLRTVCVVAVVLQVVLATPAEVCDGQGQIWAVLVAGSKGWFNYRHQADVYHAYQLFHRHGVPDSNIIVMVYDDIAYNDFNLEKGRIINTPSGQNVYPGLLKDYTNDNVTNKNFIKILTGDKQGMIGIGSGKVLQSGPNDHVFINFVGHGIPNCIVFPNYQGLWKDELINALKTMHQKKMYKKLLFYLEACYSGSMFHKALPDNIGIFATTAANPNENSFTYFCGEIPNNCISNEYSAAWMQDIDLGRHRKNQTSGTLLQHYNNVVEKVKLSHPQMYGDKSMGNDHVIDFIGQAEEYVLPGEEPSIDDLEDRVSQMEFGIKGISFTHVDFGMDSIFFEPGVDQISLEVKKQELIKARKKVDNLFDDILSHVTHQNVTDQQNLNSTHLDLEVEKVHCYKTIVESFSNTCVNIYKNYHTFGHLYKFSNLCATDYAKPEDVLKVFSDVCTEDHRALKGVN